MTSELLAAIKALLIGTPAIVAAFPGGFWAELAPANSSVATPYLVRRVISAPRDESYGNPADADVRIQFSAIGEGEAAVMTAMNVLTPYFDDAQLTLATYDNSSTIQKGEVVPHRLGFSPRSQDTYSASVDFIFHLTKH